MAKIIISGVAPFDGAYDLDISKFNGRELHTIKQISGVRAGELQEAFAAGDYDLVVAFTVIVLRRAGRTVDPDAILEADLGAITIDLGVEEEGKAVRPPTSPPPHGNESSSDGGASSSEKSQGSGEDSPPTSGQPPNHLSLTGLPGSETSAGSAPETLAS